MASVIQRKKHVSQKQGRVKGPGKKKICIFSTVFKNNLTVLRKCIFFRFFIHCLYTENEIITVYHLKPVMIKIMEALEIFLSNF